MIGWDLTAFILEAQIKRKVRTKIREMESREKSSNYLADPRKPPSVQVSLQMEEVYKKRSSFRYQSLTPEGGRPLTAPPLTSVTAPSPQLRLRWPLGVCGASGFQTTSATQVRLRLFVALRESTPRLLLGCWQPPLPPTPEGGNPVRGIVANSGKSPTEICCFFLSGSSSRYPSGKPPTAPRTESSLFGRWEGQLPSTWRPPGSGGMGAWNRKTSVSRPKREKKRNPAKQLMAGSIRKLKN